MQDRATQCHRIEPAAAPPTARDRAELMPNAREMLAVIVEQLGWKRPGTDPRGVGLDDAEHVIERTGPEAGAGGGAGQELRMLSRFLAGLCALMLAAATPAAQSAPLCTLLAEAATGKL